MLTIHAVNDEIVPFVHGTALYMATRKDYRAEPCWVQDETTHNVHTPEALFMVMQRCRSFLANIHKMERRRVSALRSFSKRIATNLSPTSSKRKSVSRLSKRSRVEAMKALLKHKRSQQSLDRIEEADGDEDEKEEEEEEGIEQNSTDELTEDEEEDQHQDIVGACNEALDQQGLERANAIEQMKRTDSLSALSAKELSMCCVSLA